MNLQRIKSVLAIGLVLTSASWLSAQVRTLGGLPAVPQHAAKQAKQKKAPKPASATKSGFGWMIATELDDDDEEVENFGYATISLTSGAVTTKYKNAYQSCAGAYANGTYYGYTCRFSGSSLTPKNFVKLDVNTGTYTTVADYSKMTTGYNDMTFDYTTQTMWVLGVNSDATASVLGTVDLATGAYTAKYDLGQGFLTLAATYSGQLYGISLAGDLYTIDKTTGATAKVGATGVTPAYNQSMEFDHTDETLYWAETDRRGSNLYTVDVTTGKAQKVSTLGYDDDAQITGLYVPFTIKSDDVPAAATGLTATAISGTAIKLAWTNPTLTKGGKPLGSIAQVVVSRDGTAIDTITGTAPGAQLTYTDNHGGSSSSWSATSKSVYEVVAYNEAGDGLGATATGVRGEDYPGKVQNLKVARVDGKAQLTWSAPVDGESGGWFDAATLTYKIRRGTDVLVSGLAANTYTDTAGVKSAFYTYRVTSQTKNRIFGADEYTEPVFVGEADNLPQKYEFTAAGFKGWNVIDVNGSEETWKPLVEDERNTAQMYAYDHTADCWLISRPFKLEAGNTYRAKFDAKAEFSFLPAEMEVWILKDGNRQNGKLQLKETVKNTLFSPRSVEFTAAETGDYSLAFRCLSSISGARLNIADPEVEEFYDADMAVDELTVTKYPVAGKSYQQQVVVRNNGSKPQTAYTVNLLQRKADGSSQVLLSAKPGVTLAPDSTVTVKFNLNCTAEGPLGLQAQVVLAGDKNALNDTSAVKQVNVQPAGSDDVVEIGKREDVYGYLPIGFVYESTMAQTVYTAQEINKGLCSIKRIAWPYKYSTGISDVRVKVLVGNTTAPNLKKTFVDTLALTKVFDGTVTMIGDNTEHELVIEFDKPYFYNGGNLCIMTEKRDTKTMTRYGGGYCTNDTKLTDRTRSWQYSTLTGQYTLTQGMSTDAIPDIKLYAEVDGAKLSGAVTDGGEAVTGGTVTVSELNAAAVTDAEGRYSFAYLPAGTYTVNVANADSSKTATRTVTVAKGEAMTLNVELSPSTGVTAPEDAAGTVKLYPVPADQTLNVSGSYDRLRLVSSTGATVLEANGGQSQIGVGGLGSGIYLAIISYNGVTTVQKVVIKH